VHAVPGARVVPAARVRLNCRVLRTVIRQMTDAPQTAIGCTSYTLDPWAP